jgi:hypothetical protein
MTTTTVAADAGLPNETRRRLLLGLAAASTAAAATAVGAAAAAELEEDPELLRLGPEIEAAVKRWQSAWAHRNAVLKEWDAKLPEPPADITHPVWFTGAAYWKHIDGRDRLVPLVGSRSDYKVRVSVVTPDGIEERQNEIRRFLTLKRIKDGKSWRGKNRVQWEQELERLDGLKPIAARWHADTARIMAAPPYRDAEERLTLALGAVLDPTERLMNIPSRTMAGVVVKCRALEAISALGMVTLLAGAWKPKKPLWPNLIAADVLRLAERHATA